MRRGGGRAGCGGPGRRALALLAAAACFAPALPAAAQQGGSANERIAAEALFREALQLMGEGNYAEACPKLAESQRLDPGLGTLINLALCHEAEGKTASAWLEFNEVASLARQAKRADRERVARTHVRALEPKLAKLSVRVSAEARAVSGLEVRRDGLTLKEGVWGSPIPVDPGRHEVSASAPGYETWLTTVEIPPEPGQHDVTVPELAKKKEEAPAAEPAAPRAAPAPPAPLPAKPSALSQRAVGFAVGGAGLAALLVGGYFGYRAVDKAGEVDERCPNERCVDAGAVELNDEAKFAANVANVAIGVGVVGLGVGALLVLTAPSAGKAPSTGGAAPRSALPGRWLLPEVGRDHVALRLGGAW
ncbi:MAG TPA: hypothetical protein VFS43_23760 [Polyangiaceae bacterium]|nr:hypothetical protein [Polyangiaceae bacterium]